MSAPVIEDAPHLTELLERVSAIKGFNQPRYHVTVGTKPGDNYAGAVYRAVLTEDGVEPLSVILKTVPSSAKRREMMQSDSMFRNEAGMYNTVLPAYVDLLVENGLILEGEPYPDAPECILVSMDGAESEATLVLRDMRPLGFTMLERKKGVGLEHCLLVVRALARLHACSMALEHLQPERAARVRASVREQCFLETSAYANAFGPALDRAEEIMKTRMEASRFAKVKSFFDNYFSEMCDTVTPDPDGGNCIVHGDSWINNLLFKYSQYSGNVEAVCLLDFQISRYCSPILDLMYLIYNCTEREMRDKHLNDIHRAYLDQLHSRLRDLGCEPDPIFSWERMQSHLKKYGRYGLGMSVMLIPIMLADSDDVPDLNAECETGQDLGEIFVFGGEDEVRDKRMCDVAEEMVDLGYL